MDYKTLYKMLDISQWLQMCKETGFVDNINTKIYGELPVQISFHMKMRWLNGWQNMYLPLENHEI